jgi:recombination protein RecA
MAKEQNTNMDKNAVLESAIKQLKKQFGDGAVMKMSEKPEMEIDVISTGSLNLDRALGVGGLPKGRIIEVYGPESTGKSTLAMHCVAEAQKKGGIACYIDAEHAMDPAYAKALGVDVENLLISQPDCGEEALEICDAMVRSGCIDIIVVDSVAALTPKSELEGEMGDASVGVQARLKHWAA